MEAVKKIAACSSREVTLLHVTFLMLWLLASSFHQGDRIKVIFGMGKIEEAGMEGVVEEGVT